MRGSPVEAFIAAQVGAFRKRASLLTEYGAREAGGCLERAAKDLENAFRTWWLAELTVAEAAEEAGYSEERMRELIRSGRSEQGGPLRVRRCDLPRKASPPLSGGGLRRVADRLGIR